MEKPVKNFLLFIGTSIMICTSLILLMLSATSCSIALNQTDGPAEDSIDQNQNVAPKLNATIPLPLACLEDEEPIIIEDIYPIACAKCR